jgi:hypothetical protein
LIAVARIAGIDLQELICRKSFEPSVRSRYRIDVAWSGTGLAGD